MSYLLRVVLPNRPGALGALATALGRVGADIQNLIVVERNAEAAVDDVLVDLPAPGLADTLLTAAHSVPGAYVESLARYGGRLDLQDDLAFLDSLADAGPDRLERFTAGLPDVLRAQWALLLDTVDAPPGSWFASAGAPGSPPRTDWLPLAEPRLVDPGEVWADPTVCGPDPQLAAAPMGAAGRVLLVGRCGGPVFRASELHRLGYLAAVTAGVRAPAGPDPLAGGP